MQGKERLEEWIFFFSWRARNFEINLTDRYDWRFFSQMEMFSNYYPFEMSRLLFTMLFSPHGWAPPISWHMCNILRSPCLPACLSLPTSWRFLRKKRARSTRYTPNSFSKEKSATKPGFAQFRCNKFSPFDISYFLRDRKRARKKKKETSIRLPRLERSQLYTLSRGEEEAISYSPLIRSFKITLLPLSLPFQSRIRVIVLSLTIRRR